jgi:transcriptional regulator with XRE-family HTH domain
VDIADLLRTARRTAGLTQAQLASAAGVGRSALAQYERGTRVPALATFERVLAAAGLQVSATLEPSGAELSTGVRRAAAEPLQARRAVQAWWFVGDVTGLSYRLEGVGAASMLGVPAEPSALEVAVADDDTTFAWLARRLGDYLRLRFDGEMAGPCLRVPPEQVRQVLAERCPDGRFEIVTPLDAVWQVRLASPRDVARRVTVAIPGAEDREPGHDVVHCQPLDEIARVWPELARVIAIVEAQADAE